MENCFIGLNFQCAVLLRYDQTVEADPIWEEIEALSHDMYARAEKIVNENLPDMSQRAAMRLAGWFPKTPLQKAIEWYEYDWEWTSKSDITSLQVSFLTEFSQMVSIRGYSINPRLLKVCCLTYLPKEV